MKKLAIIGGGAAGFFAAINAAKFSSDLEVCIYEKSSQLLGKVKVSGGGRCNVTHACFEPKELIGFYPRGSKELLGPFHKFQPGDTIEWFQQRGIVLKTESDGRMFPESNSSQTIIDCFLAEAQKYQVEVRLQHGIQDICRNGGKWNLIAGEQSFEADFLLVTSGSSQQVWSILEKLGHHLVAPVPSLFTMNISDERIKMIPGLSSPNALVTFNDHTTVGPVLVTHWGLSGPAILKMSAWAALEMNQKGYEFDLGVNWDGNYDLHTIRDYLKELRQSEPKRSVLASSPISIPHQLWKALLVDIPADLKWADCSNAHIDKISSYICESSFEVRGKSTFKEEFVTAGGIDLKEVDFRTMESRIQANLFFAGEVLNIDAVTGGFNFQSAWTTGWIAAQTIASKVTMLESDR